MTLLQIARGLSLNELRYLQFPAFIPLFFSCPELRRSVPFSYQCLSYSRSSLPSHRRRGKRLVGLSPRGFPKRSGSSSGARTSLRGAARTAKPSDRVSAKRKECHPPSLGIRVFDRLDHWHAHSGLRRHHRWVFQGRHKSSRHRHGEPRQRSKITSHIVRQFRNICD